MKSIFGYLFITITALSACKSSHQDYKSINDSIAKTIKLTSADSSEYIDLNEAKINGIAHAFSVTKVLYTALGKPDNISSEVSNMAGYYPERDFKYLYIKGCTFELYDNITTVLESLYFKKSGLKLMTPTLVLDGNTTLTSLAKPFPYAFKTQYELDENNEKLTAISISAWKDGINMPGLGDSWILLFNDNKLVKIYLIPYRAPR